ncbi:MAG TPA: FTR1 family protein [Gemmatimonadaceae bacterium]
MSHSRSNPIPRVLLIAGGLVVLGILLWQALAAAGAPDPTTPHTTAAVATLDIAILVFREGLECVLVLLAITAGMHGQQTRYRQPIAWGAAAAFVASIITWFIAAGAIDALSNSIPALDIQAATGLLAIIVLLVVMNWFFHRVYWTGWISMHNRRKRELLDDSSDAQQGMSSNQRNVLLGFAALGFTSLYREGFEVVLFLQTYRLQLGSHIVFGGVLIGATLASIVAVLAFVARTRLPYKQMLVATGVMLGVVLLVMVGEQAQEMQLAHWIPTTTIHALDGKIPSWTGLWFSVFPTVETLLAQGAAAALVLGSYVTARARTLRAG